MDTYLTPEEVAEALKVTPRAVYGWLRTGRLEAYKPFGRWRVTPQQVDKFMKGGLNVPGQIIFDNQKPSLPVTELRPASVAESQKPGAITNQPVPMTAALQPKQSNQPLTRSERRRQQGRR